MLRLVTFAKAVPHALRFFCFRRGWFGIRCVQTLSFWASNQIWLFDFHCKIAVEFCFAASIGASLPSMSTNSALLSADIIGNFLARRSLWISMWPNKNKASPNKNSAGSILVLFCNSLYSMPVLMPQLSGRVSTDLICIMKRACGKRFAFNLKTSDVIRENIACLITYVAGSFDIAASILTNVSELLRYLDKPTQRAWKGLHIERRTKHIR